MTVLHRFRKLVFWLHLIAGCAAGIVILLMALTGTVLMYERQILEWVDGYQIAQADGDAKRLPLEELVGKVNETSPKQPVTAVTVEADPAQSVALSLGRDGVKFIHPYTGEILGDGAPKTRDFFHLVTELHRWLALSGEQRDVGKAVTGAACLVFLFLVLSGLYLWFPRRLTWHFIKRIVAFDRRLTGRARDWNWHNVFGFWACLPLLFIILTGLVMAYPWANNLLFTLTGNPVPPPRAAGGGRGAAAPAPVPVAGLDKAFALAKEKVPAWQSITLRLPAAAKAPAMIFISESHQGRPDLKSQLNVNLATGEVATWETFDSYNLGKKLRFWSRWVHTGEAGGIVGQTVAGLSAIAAAILVWTGFAMSWQRFKRRKKQK